MFYFTVHFDLQANNINHSYFSSEKNDNTPSKCNLIPVSILAYCV